MGKSLNYHPKELLGEITDLENKTLLDVGSGPDCNFCWSYVSHIYRRSQDLNQRELNLNF